MLVWESYGISAALIMQVPRIMSHLCVFAALAGISVAVWANSDGSAALDPVCVGSVKKIVVPVRPGSAVNSGRLQVFEHMKVIDEGFRGWKDVLRLIRSRIIRLQNAGASVGEPDASWVSAVEQGDQLSAEQQLLMVAALAEVLSPVEYRLFFAQEHLRATCDQLTSSLEVGDSLSFDSIRKSLEPKIAEIDRQEKMLELLKRKGWQTDQLRTEYGGLAVIIVKGQSSQPVSGDRLAKLNGAYQAAQLLPDAPDTRFVRLASNISEKLSRIRRDLLDAIDKGLVSREEILEVQSGPEGQCEKLLDGSLSYSPGVVVPPWLKSLDRLIQRLPTQPNVIKEAIEEKRRKIAEASAAKAQESGEQIDDAAARVQADQTLFRKCYPLGIQPAEAAWLIEGKRAERLRRILGNADNRKSRLFTDDEYEILERRLNDLFPPEVAELDAQQAKAVREGLRLLADRHQLEEFANRNNYPIIYLERLKQPNNTDQLPPRLFDQMAQHFSEDSLRAASDQPQDRQSAKDALDPIAKRTGIPNTSLQLIIARALHLDVSALSSSHVRSFRWPAYQEPVLSKEELDLFYRRVYELRRIYNSNLVDGVQDPIVVSQLEVIQRGRDPKGLFAPTVRQINEKHRLSLENARFQLRAGGPDAKQIYELLAELSSRRLLPDVERETRVSMSILQNMSSGLGPGILLPDNFLTTLLRIKNRSR